MAVDEWAVTFGTVRRGLGGAAAHRIVGPRSRVVRTPTRIVLVSVA